MGDVSGWDVDVTGTHRHACYVRVRFAVSQPATEIAHEFQQLGFRLGRDAWNRYSAEAQQRGVALGTHLRQRLEWA